VLITCEDLEKMPDHRFVLMSRDQVWAAYCAAEEAKAVRAFMEERRKAAMDRFVAGESGAEEQVEAANKIIAALPVPARLAPIYRWVGGSTVDDKWYWDCDSYYKRWL
jgi:hypothetical protein